MQEIRKIQSILEAALKYADKKNAHRITDLHIQIGELNNLMPESIQKNWELLSKDTIAAGAILHFMHIPAKYQCMACFQKYNPPDTNQFECPNCGSVGVKIISGEEFSVQAIDVADITS